MLNTGRMLNTVYINVDRGAYLLSGKDFNSHILG